MFESIAGNLLVVSEHGDNAQLLLQLPNGTQKVIARGDVRAIQEKHHAAVADLGKQLESFLGNLTAKSDKEAAAAN